MKPRKFTWICGAEFTVKLSKNRQTIYYQYLFSYPEAGGGRSALQNSSCLVKQLRKILDRKNERPCYDGGGPYCRVLPGIHVSDGDMHLEKDEVVAMRRTIRAVFRHLGLSTTEVTT